MARSSTNEEAQDQEEGGHGITGSGAVVAAAAAAATGAATYAVRRARANRAAGDEDDGEEQEEPEEGGLASKKDDLAEALSAKASDIKQAAAKLRPRRNDSTLSSVASSAWTAAWGHLLPVAGQVAASLGKTVADKAPEPVRKEIVPRFIEGFQRGS